MHLDAERTADVFSQHAHLVLLETEVLGEQVLHHVRRLRALIDGQASLARIPIGDDGARLVGDAGVAAERECRLHHRVGVGKAFVGIAYVQCALEGEIVAECGMDHGRRRVERRFRVGHSGERFIVDIHECAGVLRLRACVGDHCAYRFTLPAGPVHRDGVLRRRLDAFQMREHADPRRDHLGKLRTGDDGDDAWSLFCLFRADVLDARMGVRRS